MKRFTDEHLNTWRRDGAVLIPNFFTEQEVAPVRADFDHLYGDARRGNGEAVSLKAPGEIGLFNTDQFRNFEDMPFDCSDALNMIALHPALIEFAKAALQTDKVHLYQSHSWAKFTGDTDYDQMFHCDFKNHTLTVPSEQTSLRTVNIMIYFTDVTDRHGALHYVPQGESDAITGPDRTMFVDAETMARLKTKERSAAGPAGSIMAYGIDVFHRGTNLTEPNGRRYTLTASFKARGNDMIGWSAWPFSFMKPWHLIINNATPEQLACLGIPEPGDPFWTARTIARTRERWPDMNLAPYEEALA